jgi:hypothetical protein
MIAATVAFLASSASAQDMPKEAPKEAPPPKHVNKITPAAQAVFDKIGALMYSPLKGGLKDLTGAVKMEMEGAAAGEGRKGPMAAMGKMDLVFAVAFKAPADLKVELKDAPGKAEAEKAGEGMGARMMKSMGEGMSLAVTRILRSTLEGFVPAGDSEFDADVKVENGVTTLLLTTYLKGAEVARQEITLDAGGIPSVMVTTPKAGGAAADGKSTAKFAYAKDGDLFRLEKMTLDSPRGAMEAKLAYADAGNFKVVRSWEMAPADGPFKFGFKFSEMIVNGKPVDLGSPAPKPEEKKEPAKGE